MPSLKDLALNTALVIAACGAITMVSVRLHDRFFARASEPKLRQIPEWRDYAAVGRRIGPPTALVTIVDFSDFQCPYCLRAWEDLRQMREQYPEKIALVFRHFPLPMHRLAADAARASECAGQQGAFESYQQALFSSQGLIESRSFAEFALTAGISNTNLFEVCMDDRATLTTVERDEAAGKKLGVVGTPTLLINDLELIGYPGSDELRGMIRSELDNARARSGR